MAKFYCVLFQVFSWPFFPQTDTLLLSILFLLGIKIFLFWPREPHGICMTTSTSWRPFCMVSLALMMGTMGTALASPLYPLYQALWHLVPSQITYIFVAYMFGCLATLLFLGRTSNSIGYLRTLQVGLVFISIGLVISAYASDALILSLGRFIIGIASC